MTVAIPIVTVIIVMAVIIMVVIIVPAEIEHVEQVADRRHVDGNVDVVVVVARIGQIIAAARR